MYLGIVKGTVVAERKAAGLEGKKLLLVQPVDEHGAPLGDVQAAVDTVQAGDGDLVYLVGSREAALACDPGLVGVAASVVGGGALRWSRASGGPPTRPAEGAPGGSRPRRPPDGGDGQASSVR